MIRFSSRGWGDYASWADDRKTLRRINRLTNEAARAPASGIGKPEPLKGDLAGHWSRRIDQEHRLVYSVARNGYLVIVQARHHY